MGLLDKIKNVFSAGDENDAEFKDIISGSTKECLRANINVLDIKVNTLSFYNNEVINWTDKKKIDFALYCMKKIHEYNNNSSTSYSTTDADFQDNKIRNKYLSHLFKARLVLEEEDLSRLIEAFLKYKKSDWAGVLSWPIGTMLNLLDKQFKDSNPSEKMIGDLNHLKKRLEQIKNSSDEKERVKLIDKIGSLTFKSQNPTDALRPVLFLGKDAFSDYANAYIEALPADDKKIWYKLIAKAQKASGSQPPKKYLDETKLLFKEIGADKFKKTVNDWFVFLIGLKEVTTQYHQTYGDRTYTYNVSEYLSTINVEAVKGVVWMCAHFHDATTLHNVSRLAERCHKKIPGKGPAAAAIGNACIFMLYKSKGLDGIGQLSRLKLRIKQNSTQQIIEKYLIKAADEQGVTLHEIEDLAVDHFDLADGVKEAEFDDYKCILKIIRPGKSELSWFKADGTPQKSVPAFVKEKYAAKLKKLKDSQKQIDQTTSAQRDRIDRMFRSDRKWSFDNFSKYYMEHGLMSFLAKKIIWDFNADGKKVSVIFKDNQWVNSSSETIVPSTNSEVSLWHPALHSMAEIKSWREFLVSNKIQQPLKQAFREVYLLTDAEVKTKIYSNRMAAHILKQHQYVTLAKGRSWTAKLMGNWDGGFDDIAELRIPEYGLKAQFWVQSVMDDNQVNDTGIWNYVSTDQIRFVHPESNDAVDLAEVPTVLFSEVLRDVDLFVGVASVGNDPSWRDSGGMPGYRDYWTSYSFGDLSELAKNRKEILTSLIPRLKINKVAEIKDKFLVVKGKLRTYKIHIGSTNILMEPNDQYLCIVPDRNQKNPTENLFIPFEGDSGLSIILSKAFLLAEDDKIKDSTITSQINKN